MRRIIKYIAVVLLTVNCPLSTVHSQIVRDIIKKSPSYSSCNYDVYPDTITAVLTSPLRARSPSISPITVATARAISATVTVTRFHIS